MSHRSLYSIFGLIFTLSNLSLANADLIRVADPAQLKTELSATDGIARIALIVELNEEGKPANGASQGAIRKLNAALKSLGKKRQKNVLGYLIGMSDKNSIKSLSELPRFPKNGPSAYPYYAFFKNGGVQGKLIGFKHAEKEILLQVSYLDRFKKVPTNWILNASEITVQYVYDSKNCTVEQVKADIKALDKMSKELGVPYDVVAVDEEHPGFKGFKGIDMYFGANPQGIFGEDDCRQVTALITWQGIDGPSSFYVVEHHKQGAIESKAINEAVIKLSKGDY